MNRKEAKAKAEAARRRAVIRSVRKGKTTPEDAAEQLTNPPKRGRGGTLWNPRDGAGPHARTRLRAAGAAAVALLAVAHPAARPAAPAHLALGVNLSNGSCPNEFVAGSVGGTPVNMQLHWTSNGCGWYMRPHIHCGIPKIGDDDGYFDGGYVKSVNFTTQATCPDSSDQIIQGYVQWKHSSTGTVSTRQIYP